VPEYTRPATWDDVKKLAALLNQAGVEYALVGGYAIAAHGFNRFSEDIDILVNPAVENSRRWIVALGELPDHATRELSPNPDVFADDARYAVRINDEFTIDIMPSIAGRTWQEMRTHIETIDLDGVPARPKDQMDAALLSQAIAALKDRQ
jgi:ABC-type glycerol-3-phosphate transport system substrate-binding protein